MDRIFDDLTGQDLTGVPVCIVQMWDENGSASRLQLSTDSFQQFIGLIPNSAPTPVLASPPITEPPISQPIA